jgi:microcystin-dependent protein
MIKRFFLALAFAAGLLSPVYASGTIPFSLSQQFDSLGKPLAGCLFYSIQAGTTSTPQNAYQDSALTIPLPNPQTCDAAGRLPQMFFADGTIKVRLADKNGVTQVVADNIQVIGASSGSGGGGTVDPTTILSTGDIKATYGTGTLSGFVRANGRTIGSATSGATERANSDAQQLFEYLWGADANLVVSGGRGASAAADWAANKTIALPDLRGRVIAGLDDMGNSSASRLSDVISDGSTTLGAPGGEQKHTIARSELVNLPFSFSGSAGTVNVTSTDGAAFISQPIGISVNTGASASAGTGFSIVHSSGTFTPSGTISPSNLNGNVSQTAMNVTQPTMLMTFYIKL